jgi:hypothetical protein
MNIRLVFVLFLSCVYGCASTPRLPHIAAGEPVAITVALSAKADGQSDFQNDAMGKDVGKGAGGGALVGGLYGLTCGPFMIFCVPVGAAVGAVAGSAGGAVASIDGGLSKDEADQLRDRLLRLNSSRDKLDELATNITDRAGRYWDLDSEEPRHRVGVEVLDLIMASTHDNQVRCILRVLVSVEKAGDKPARAPRQKTYEYAGPYASLAVWLDENSDFADTSLSNAIAQISSQVVSDLAVN